MTSYLTFAFCTFGPMRNLARLLVVVGLTGALLAAGVVLLAPQGRALLGSTSGSESPINLEPLHERSVVYAADGSVLAVLHAEENRRPVPLEEMSQVLVEAIIAVEDERFWEHNGFDLRGTVRALYTNVQAGSIEQGGSTITQQLVKNALLTSKRTAGRKVREAILALRLEDQYSKEEILERYLNTVYFGNGAYGVQAAAERYFGISANAVDAGQAALLAGLIRNPLGYDPFTRPDAALERRRFSLQRMSAHEVIPPAQVDFLANAPLPARAVRTLPQPTPFLGYFVEEVKQRLLDDVRLGDTPAERYNAVFKGGLQIHTTLEPHMQAAAQDAVNRIVPNTNGAFTAAVVSIDPTDGAVRALVGGPGFDRAKYNLVTQGHRQAGSAFKVFPLVHALERGHSPRDTISGASPCSLPNPGGTPNPWRPSNNEGSSSGTITLDQATRNSVNCAYARLGLILGVDQIAETATRMGIVTPIEPTPAMVLGGLKNGVSPLEMASAYATLAADGIHHAPYFISRVLDPTGDEILTERGGGTRAVSAQTARLATQILRGVVTGGTGTRARVSGWQVAGKTGTAQDYEDAWFVGYTTKLATAVWMGSPVGEVPMRNVGGIRVFGGTYPARIFGAFMTAAHENVEPESFEDPNSRLIPRGKYLQLRGDRTVRTRSTTPRTRVTRAPAPAADSEDRDEPTATTAPPPADGDNDDDDDEGGGDKSPDPTDPPSPTNPEPPPDRPPAEDASG
jgi:penicillin-binding protein 1A